MCLQELHNYDIIVGQLLPENILIKNNDMIKICGLSNIMKVDDNKQEQIRGIKEYLPPEWYKEALFYKQSDFWNLGVLLYEMLVGCCPFHHDNDEFLIKEILQLPVVFPPFRDISQQCQNFILKCLQKDYKERYQSVLEVLQSEWFKDYLFLPFEDQLEDLHSGHNYDKFYDDYQNDTDEELTKIQTENRAQLLKQINTEFTYYNYQQDKQ